MGVVIIKILQLCLRDKISADSIVLKVARVASIHRKFENSIRHRWAEFYRVVRCKRKKSIVDSLRNATMWDPALPLAKPSSRSSLAGHHSPPSSLTASIFLLSSRQDNYRLSHSEVSISQLTAFWAFVLAIRNCCECQGLYCTNVVWFFFNTIRGHFLHS